MGLSRLLARGVCVAAAVVLCACASTTSSSSSSSPSSSPSSSRSASKCPYASDSVTAVKALVQVEAVGSTVEQTVSPGKSEPLGCGATVTVSPSGTAMAEFGSQGGCQLQEFGGQPGSLTSRDPAADLATLNSGYLRCTVNGSVSSPHSVQCPNGSVVTQNTKLVVICEPGTTFEVAVYRGSARVFDKKGNHQLVPAGMSASLDIKDGAFRPAKANFTPQDLAGFSALASQRSLAAGGVALHAARVGGGVQDPVAAGDSADPAERPGRADVDQVAPPSQVLDHRGADP
jgi:hypothetical protein